MAQQRVMRLRINGKDHPLALDTRVTLLDALREHAHLTGAKKAAITGNAAPVRCILTANAY